MKGIRTNQQSYKKCSNCNSSSFSSDDTCISCGEKFNIENTKYKSFSLYNNCPKCNSSKIISTNDGYRTQICTSCGLKIVKNGILYTENKDN